MFKKQTLILKYIDFVLLDILNFFFTFLCTSYDLSVDKGKNYIHVSTFVHTS